jgi:hypothetical protein
MNKNDAVGFILKGFLYIQDRPTTQLCLKAVDGPAKGQTPGF